MNQIARERGCARSTVGVALADLGFKIKERRELRCSKGQVPFGFRVLHGDLVPHRGEKTTVDQMLEMKISGSSYGQIAAWLNSSGVATKNKVGQWDRPTIYKILKNRLSNPNANRTQITI